MIRTSIFIASMLLSFISSTSHAQNEIDFFDLSLEELVNISITSATRIAEPISKSTSHVSVLTQKDIKYTGARTIYDALRLIPGIVIREQELGEITIGMHGVSQTGSPGILIMLNGHVINAVRSGSAGNQYLDRLAITNIKQIEVIKGPGSAVYGANAFIGLINIITVNGSLETNTKNHQTQLSASSEFEDSATIGQKYNFLQTGTFSGIHDYSLNLNYSDYKKSDRFVKQDSLGFSGQADTEEAYYDGQFRVEGEHYFINTRGFKRDAGGYYGFGGVLSDETDMNTKGGFIETGGRFNLTQHLQFKQSIYYNYIEMENFLSFTPNATLVGLIAIKEKSYGGDSEFTLSYFDSHIIHFGAATRKEEQYDPTTKTNLPVGGPLVDVTNVANWITPAERRINSLYLEDIWDVYNFLRITSGIRYDHFSDFGDTVNPRIGANYTITGGHAFKISYGTAFRAPDFGSQHVQNNNFIIGDPDLEAEKINTFELGYYDTFNNRHWGSLIYTHSELDNLIDKPGSTTQLQGANAYVDSLELERNIQLNTDLSIKLHYVYTHSRYNGHSFYPSVPKHQAGLNLNYALTDTVHFNTNAQWLDKLPRGNNDSREDIDSSVVFNATLIVEEILSHAYLQLSVFNLFDESYVSPETDNLLPYDYPAQKRSFVAKMAFDF